MAEFDESLEELQEKQRLYEEQLQQVEAALQQDPTEDLRKLKADLQEVITLTQHLLQYKQQQQPQQAETSTTTTATTGDAQTEAKTGDAASQAAADSATEIRESRQAPVSSKDGRDQTPAVSTFPAQTAAGSSSSSSSSAAVAATAPKPQGTPSSIVGRTCSAEYEGKKYYAKILEVKRDAKLGERVSVEFIGWGNCEEYPLQHITLLPTANREKIQSDTKAQAIFSGDGRWYDCTVIAVLTDGFKVRFDAYGDEEEVPGDRVRERRAPTSKKTKELITPGGYRIPLYLAAKPTDTEAQKNSKKRRVKAIKQQQKLEMAEKEMCDSAKSWQQFNKKASKRAMVGFMTGRNHESIFRDIEVKQNKNPTEFAHNVKLQQAFQPRRKHDFVEDSFQDD